MWYVVKVLTCAEVHDGLDEPKLHEEALWLVCASSAEEAEAKTTALVRQQLSEYENPQGHKVRWKFVRVCEVESLPSKDIVDGTEVWSRLYLMDKAGFELPLAGEDDAGDDWKRRLPSD